MYQRFGYGAFVWNTRDRRDVIISTVSILVRALPEDIQNKMNDADWAEQVKLAIRESFPDMSDLTKNARYVSLLVQMSQKCTKMDKEWIDAAWARRAYRWHKDGLHHAHQRRIASDVREHYRIVRKAWRWMIQRSGWNYDRSARFARYVEKRVITYQARNTI